MALLEEPPMIVMKCCVYQITKLLLFDIDLRKNPEELKTKELTKNT